MIRYVAVRMLTAYLKIALQHEYNYYKVPYFQGTKYNLVYYIDLHAKSLFTIAQLTPPFE